MSRINSSKSKIIIIIIIISIDSQVRMQLTNNSGIQSKLKWPPKKQVTNTPVTLLSIVSVLSVIIIIVTPKVTYLIDLYIKAPCKFIGHQYCIRYQDACTLVLGTGCAVCTYYRKWRNHCILHVSTIQQLWSFMVWGLVLSCQIQDNLSPYYNMVAVNGKMDPKNARKVSANAGKFQQQKHPVTVGLPGYQV